MCVNLKPRGVNLKPRCVNLKPRCVNLKPRCVKLTPAVKPVVHLPSETRWHSSTSQRLVSSPTNAKSRLKTSWFSQPCYVMQPRLVIVAQHPGHVPDVVSAGDMKRLPGHQPSILHVSVPVIAVCNMPFRLILYGSAGLPKIVLCECRA